MEITGGQVEREPLDMEGFEIEKEHCLQMAMVLRQLSSPTLSPALPIQRRLQKNSFLQGHDSSNSGHEACHKSDLHQSSSWLSIYPLYTRDSVRLEE